MTFATNEVSAQLGRPIERYTFEVPTATYYLTSYGEDVVFGGITYVATPIRRGHTSKVPLGETREMTVSMAVNHTLVQTLLGNGIPPRDVLVTIERCHVGSSGFGADLRQVWRGYVTSIETDDENAVIHVPCSVDDAFNVRLPVLKAQRQCNHHLYSKGCVGNPVNIDRTGFQVVTTVSGVSGTTLTVNSIGGKPDQWAQYGEVVRSLDLERRTIVAQVGAILTLDVPFGTLNTTDDVTIYAGCDHKAETCRDKFVNIVNFGGHPVLPVNNPSSPTGFGVVQQS